MAARSRRLRRLAVPSGRCERQRWKIRLSPWWRAIPLSWWACAMLGLTISRSRVDACSNAPGKRWPVPCQAPGSGLSPSRLRLATDRALRSPSASLVLSHTPRTTTSLLSCRARGLDGCCRTPNSSSRPDALAPLVPQRPRQICQKPTERRRQPRLGPHDRSLTRHTRPQRSLSLAPHAVRRSGGSWPAGSTQSNMYGLTSTLANSAQVLSAARGMADLGHSGFRRIAAVPVADAVGCGCSPCILSFSNTALTNSLPAPRAALILTWSAY